MAHHVVLGAGGIGRDVAVALADAGDPVTLISRSGRKTDHPGVNALALDVTDVDALSDAATGARTVVNALNPTAYTHWERDWPPMARAVLTATERAGARLITVSNLYGYGRVDEPMTESTPLRPNGVKGETRAQMWRDALARHEAGGLQVAEVRGSDYVGPATLASSLLSSMAIPALLKGRTAWVPMGRADVLHSWTHDGDVAALVAAMALRDQDDDWGRPWHVPTDAAVSLQTVADLVGELAGLRAPKVRTMPRGVVSLGGLVVPILGALKETRHQFEAPFIIDSTAAQSHFGLRPTPLRESLAQTVAALRRT